MSQERLRILNMVAEGKITPQEAEQLLQVLNEPSAEASISTTKNPKFLRVKVTGEDEVDVRVPFGILRTGIKLTSLIPPIAIAHIDRQMKEKGIDFDISQLKKEDLDELVSQLAEMQIDVKSRTGDNVRVFCE